MKLQDLTRPPLLTVGVVGVLGLAAMAAAGFALGLAVGRDPEAAKRRVRAVVDDAARAFERASLLAAQARERAGDLWAEARTQAVSEVDEQDFARASAAATAADAAAAEEREAGDLDTPPQRTKPRRGARPATQKTTGAVPGTKAPAKPRAEPSGSRRPTSAQEDNESSTAETDSAAPGSTRG
jgi:hypothetical protein